MMDKAAAVPARPAQSRGVATATLALIAVVVLLAGTAGAPYLFRGATLRSEVAAQVRATTGLVLSSNEHARFDLLPRPHVTMTGLHVTDPSGTLAIDADALEGDVRLLPLIVGRLELSAATLVRPKLAIDLDGRSMQPDSMIGRAMHGAEAPRPNGAQRLGAVTLVDGTAVLKSRSFRQAPVLDEINMTLDWPDLESPATLTGSLMIQKTATEVAAWVAQPSSLMRGDASPIALRIQSAPLDLSANGDFVDAAASSFRGHLSLKAPSLPALLALAGTRTSAPAPFANVVLNSDATFDMARDGHMAIDLSSLHLDLDGNDYEGTLAFQSGAKPILSGTLATDQLAFAPFLAREPMLIDARRQWSRAPLPLARDDLVDLDLRVSATHVRIAPFAIDDAALAIMTRGDRTEIALVEGKAYGGDIKGRVSIGASGGSLSLRGAGSLTDADAATLSWDAFGRQLAAGTVSASANLETSGDSPAALMGHLQGWAKGHAGDGELSGADIGRALREIAAKRIGSALLALRYGRTPFSNLTFSLRLADGVATIEDASMVGADSKLTVVGEADIGTRRLDLHALAVPPEAVSGAANKGARLDAEVRGPFDHVVVTPDVAGAH